MRVLLYAAVGLALVPGVANAVDTAMAPQGYTGLGITPSARWLDWGQVELAYDNQIPGGPTSGKLSGTNGHNYIAGFGLLPNLEFSGRIAANTNNTNCYTEGCGARDMSANFKTGIGLGTSNRFRIAAGATDFGGSVTFFRSYFAVGTYSTETVDFSLGVAKRSGGVLGSQAPLNGLFGSAAFQPLPWMQGYVEFSDKNAWVGARVFAPSQWLPDGWRAHVGVNARLNENVLTQKTWLNLGVSIPLYKVPSMPEAGPKAEVVSDKSASGTYVEPSYQATALPRSDAGTDRSGGNSQMLTDLLTIVPPTADVRRSVPAPTEVGVPFAAGVTPIALNVSDGQLRLLGESLREKGLEDISVGRAPDGSIAIEANNATYNWNVIDALGVSLGVIAKQLGGLDVGYSFVLMQRQTAIVGVSGRTNCLKEWLDGAVSKCSAGHLYTPGGMALAQLHDGAFWIVKRIAPSWRTLRVSLQPVLASNLATEYGVFDYSLGLGINFQQPLWRGATAEMRYIAPLANSTDFKATGVYGSRRLREGVDRVLLTQTLRVPLELLTSELTDAEASRWGLTALTAYGAIGKINNDYNGAYGELRWEPGEGRHRFGIEGGRFTLESSVARTVYGPVSVTQPRIAEPVLASYRFSYTPTRTNFEVLGGRFMNNDNGVQLAMRQWFADTSVALYFKRTKFDYQRESATFVGLELSVPLGPRKDMNPGSLIQITGTPRWSYAAETVASGTNFVTVGHAVRPGLSTLNTTFNSDRSGLVYFEDNVRRIRDAAR